VQEEIEAVPHPALVEPLRRWDPEQIGGFVLLGRLGAGSMGQVYLGQSAAGRLVAVKTIKAGLAEEPDFRNRFGHEVAAARRVSGAFTAAVVAADAEADVPWLATVYVPAPTLSRLVRTCGPVPVPAVRWLGAGCAEALESIHGAGLVHRDLKPSNVLVSPDGPRVIDFGLARAAERIQLTVTRGSVGTPEYMAPEQARDTRQATSASDIFSLGATMLFAATGHAPYQGETVIDVLVRLATGPPDLTGLPAGLTELVGGCLERDPRNRPTSAAILARLAPGLADGMAASGDLGSAPLPREAVALIEEYRRIPRTPSQPGLPSAGSAPGAADGLRSRTDFSWQREPDSADDLTLGSAPVATPSPGSGPAAPGHRAVAGRRREAPAAGRGRRVLIGAGAVAAAIALVAAGWITGRSAPASPAARNTAGHSVPGELGPVIAPPDGQSPPPGGANPPGGGPVLATAAPGVPSVAVSQPTGDRNTVFIVRGQDWPVDKPVTIELVGKGNSPIHPVADDTGSFNYAINQDHEFYAGRLPAGRYTVRAFNAAGASAVARFLVYAG
jgi:serine/threonine protein kinase